MINIGRKGRKVSKNSCGKENCMVCKGVSKCSDSGCDERFKKCEDACKCQDVHKCLDVNKCQDVHKCQDVLRITKCLTVWKKYKILNDLNEMKTW